MINHLNSIAVFCGSKTGLNSKYAEESRALARALAETNIRLVFGGGKVGIMGIIADEMLAQGGSVLGVMPKFLVEKEIAHPHVKQFHHVNSMHERKALIAEEADGFILLPGATGSLDEFFEVLTWGMLGLHKKPCGILNVDGYYDHLIKFLDMATTQEFMRPAHRDMMIVRDNAKELLQAFEHYEATTEIKWVKTIAQT